MSRIALIVARAANGVIGAGGRIPWRIPDDMRHFRRLTLGRPCIMGRKTWESLPTKPLADRLNIVVTREKDFAAPGAVTAQSFEDALALAEAGAADEIAVIGGAAIYEAALSHAHAIHLTEVLASFDGDAFFPKLDPERWRETSREEHVTPDGLHYAFVTLERI